MYNKCVFIITPVILQTFFVALQEPVLLKGTLRMNLDPLDQYSDLQIWHALEQVSRQIVLLSHYVM